MELSDVNLKAGLAERAFDRHLPETDRTEKELLRSSSIISRTDFGSLGESSEIQTRR
ncbi:hypothetical protein [Neorhizobium sp. DAR64861/K0K2]|uniref:hypothetical protein n=1 Tax=unclassified Neorhizobium TaxID=2629175 RepID=UPI003D2DD780